ncbi:hypothetical protein BJV82DRAFT_576172 [Fennellomyces sp. T-0311]|nr:hypothetical protein BJV82DRAFT_576172 [Fennellomyces sp. T-0311]
MLSFTTASFGDKRPTKPKPLFSVLRKSNRNKEDKAQIHVTSWCDSTPKHHLEPIPYSSSVDKPKRKEHRRHSHHRHYMRSRRVSPQFLGGGPHEETIVARQAALDKLCGRQPAVATMPSPPLSPVRPPRRRTTRRNPPPSPLLDSGSSVSSASSRDYQPSLRRKHSRRPLIPAYTTHNHHSHHYSQTLAPPSPRYHTTRLPPSPRSYRNTSLTPSYTKESIRQQVKKVDEDDDVPLIHTVSPKSSQSEYLDSTDDHDENAMLNADLRRSFDYTDSENDSSSDYSESESEDEDRVVSLTRQMRSMVVNDKTRLSAVRHQ